MDKIIQEAQKRLRKLRRVRRSYYNVRRHEVKVNRSDLVLVENHVLSNAANNMMAQFEPKYEGPFVLVETHGANSRIFRDSKFHVVNIDQVRFYKDRK